jgi:hypothetical protein
MKTFKTKGLPYYVKGCNNVFNAVKTLIENKIGVTENDLEEVTVDLIPMGAKIFTYSKAKKDYNVLTWVFFASQGVTDISDLMRVQMLCIHLCDLGEKATVEMVKNTSGYKSCIYDIPDRLLSDEKIQEMIDFK